MKIKILLLILFNITAFAGEPIILKYADELVGESSDTSTTRTLLGNVQLQQGNVNVTCNRAVQYLSLNKFRLSDNVVITQNTVILRSPLVTYNGNTYIADAENSVSIQDKGMTLTAKKGDFSTKTQVANFYNDVILRDDSVTIYCDFIEHQRRNSNSKAAHNVLIKSKNSNTFLLADTIINVAKDNYSLALGNPVLFQVDTTRKLVLNSETATEEEIITLDTLSIKADTMEAFRIKDDEYYYFRGNVEIVRNALKSKANTGYYYKNREYFMLQDEPVVWYNSTQLSADTITVYLDSNRLRKINSVGNSIAITQSDTLRAEKIDQLSGDKMDIIFENDALKRIESHGNAKSLYFMTSENQPDGMIKNSAATILIDIIENEVENITLVEQIPGQYMPEPLVMGNERSFFLPKFNTSFGKPMRPDINLNLYFRNH